jgi:hypothetical protein
MTFWLGGRPQCDCSLMHHSTPFTSSSPPPVRSPPPPAFCIAIKEQQTNSVPIFVHLFLQYNDTILLQFSLFSIFLRTQLPLLLPIFKGLPIFYSYLVLYQSIPLQNSLLSHKFLIKEIFQYLILIFGRLYHKY